tara:strand:- start:3512 stop:4468 length:957 start_codon:yes stop_codon:yes gene_type:complete
MMKKTNFFSSNLFKLAIIFCCVLFIYNFFHDNEKIYNIIINADYKNSLIIILLSIFLICLYSLLTLTSLRDICKIKISSQKWYLIYFNSQFLNSIPFFGIFYRARQLKKFDLNYDKFVGMYIMIKWLYLSSLLFVLGIETLIFFYNVSYFNIKIFYIFFSLSLLIISFPYFFGKTFDNLIERFNLSDYFIFSRLKKLLNLFIISSLNKEYIKKFLKIFLFIHLVELVVIIILINSLQTDIGIKDSYIIFVGTQLIDSINIIPQNIFISEIGTGFLVQELKYDFELGVLIKLYLRFLIFFSSIFLAIAYNIINKFFIKY